MEIVINGQRYSVEAGATLLSALDALKIPHDRQGMAIALGLSVIPRSEWATTRLKEGDRVEVVTAAQGG